MAFEELFGGKRSISPEAEIVDNPNPNAMDQGGFDFETLLSDPNIIRGMGETGAALSSGESFGKSFGDFASNLTRRRQLQKGARESKKGQKTFQEELLDAIRGGTALSPKDQNDAFDNFTLDGDGNVTLSMKNTPQKQGFQRQPSLESVRRPSAGGDDLPNFSNQPGGGEFDFAGLDAEDIGMLLNAEQQFGQLSQNEMKILLAEKDRRSKAITKSKTRTEDLKILGEERLAKSLKEKRESVAKVEAAKTLAQSKLDLKDREASLRANADKLTPNELAAEQLELRKLTKEVENLEAGKGGTTPIQQANIDRMDADLKRKEIELGLKLDELEKEELFSVAPSFVDDKGNDVEVPFEEQEANAIQANSRVNNKVFYYIQQPIVTKFFDGKADQPGNVVPIFLPKHPKTGKQITSSDVMDTAKANNISPEEVLKQWGLIQ